MATKGDRGKWAEGKVRAWLQAYKESHARFTYNRLLDARSSLGAMSNPQPGDFQWFLDTGKDVWLDYAEGYAVPYTRNGLIEVKSVEHAFRLPYQNMAVDQVGRLRVRQLAGSELLVLVALRPEGQKPCWVAPTLDFLEQRDPLKPSGSWDLSCFDAYTHCDDLLEMHLK